MAKASSEIVPESNTDDVNDMAGIDLGFNEDASERELHKLVLKAANIATKAATSLSASLAPKSMALYKPFFFLFPPPPPPLF